MNFSRRRFLSLLPAHAALPLAAAFGGIDVTEDLEISLIEVSFPDLPQEFEGYKIGFVTDLHYGLTFSESYFKAIFDFLRSSKLDLLLLGGDYLYIPQAWFSRHEVFHRNLKFRDLGPHNMASAIFSELGRELQNLAVPDGIFAVYGNHDRWHSRRACAVSFEWAGVSLLVNETTSIVRSGKRLEIFGTDDYLTGFPTLPQRGTGADVNILLTHNPDYVAALLRSGSTYRPHLTLCGHTHGGQIAFPVIGPLHYNIYASSMGSGSLQLENGYVYTGRGLGTVEIPLRIGVKPELPIFTLKRGPLECRQVGSIS